MSRIGDASVLPAGRATSAEPGMLASGTRPVEGTLAWTASSTTPPPPPPATTDAQFENSDVSLVLAFVAVAVTTSPRTGASDVNVNDAKPSTFVVGPVKKMYVRPSPALTACRRRRS